MTYQINSKTFKELDTMQSLKLYFTIDVVEKYESK